MESFIVTERHICARFENLESDIMEKVREKLAGDELSCWDWWQDAYWMFEQDMLDKYGIEIDTKQTHFSFGYSQSDYVAWHLHRFADFDKFLASLGFPEEHVKLIKLMDEYGVLTFYACSGGQWGHQCSNMEWEDIDYYDDIDTSEWPISQDALCGKLSDAWDSFCSDRAYDLLKLIETEYEYHSSYEYIRELAEANDWIFDIRTGELFHADAGNVEIVTEPIEPEAA